MAMKKRFDPKLIRALFENYFKAIYDAAPKKEKSDDDDEEDDYSGDVNKVIS